MSGNGRSTESTQLDALKWRCIGPPRGGRVVAVAGDPKEPMVFYFGACAGGVWKTVDGGVYWRNVSDGYFTSSAIGALAVARSDANVVYAGTGETTIRLDVSYGNGLYRSTDAGRSWTHMGLKETRFIGKIVVHPTDPDLLYVAALGDIFGPNQERGVYRSRNGGKSWEKVLYRNPDTGAVDISMDANNPRILFAACWQTRRSFWNLSSGGPGCGLFRSTDGGDTWVEVSTRPGFATGQIGKIGVAVSPAQAGRVYAMVEAEDGKGGLYRSDNYGESWTHVNPNRDLMHRPWYYMHVFADPKHAETVYVTNLAMWKSTDGGASFSEITTPHGDNHDLWIDPENPKRMVEGNDGGACVSFNGGQSWSTIYNQLTAQFYRMDIDNQHPYRVYATQQDNTSMCVPSASEWGVITLGDCSYPGTGESGFIAVDPTDHNVVYCGAIGSSPGGNGALQRYDHRTRQIQLVNVWPEDSTGIAPKNLKYRFAWTYPIVFSPHDAKTIYAGGNCVFRTRDQGMSWEPISSDLSRNDPARQGYSGGLTNDTAGAEVHATCASVVESPHRKGEIWASTDDGLVHVMRAGANSWSNVTPPGMPELAYVGCVEISPHDADTIYVAATAYKLADYRPYLFRSKDGGKSWQSINGDYPQGEISRVVRADPVRPGLLFAGTETGIFFTLDDGQHWTRMQGGLPNCPVYDLKLKGSDLVAATHGRSFWVLDDVTPLREMGDQKATRLFSPRTTIRNKLHWSAGSNWRSGIGYGPAFGINGSTESIELPDGTKGRRHLDVGENPPNGALIYYWLGEDTSGPVSLTIQDAGGRTVAAFKSDDKDLPAAQRPSSKPGLNRFVWNLKHPGPAKLDASLRAQKFKPLAPEGDGPAGPSVVPGNYLVEFRRGDKVQRATLVVDKDPRVAATPAALAEQHKLHGALNDCLGALNGAVNRVRLLKRQLGDLQGRLGSDGQTIHEQATSVIARLDAIEAVLVDPKRESPRDVLRHPAGLNDTLLDLINVVIIADAEPPKQAHEVSQEIIAKVSAEIAKLDALTAGDIAALNAALTPVLAFVTTAKPGG